MNIFSGKWPFYLSGTMMALLIIGGLYLFDAPVGMSNGYLTLSHYWGKVIEHRQLNQAPEIDWQTGFLIGIFGGALLTALISRQWKFEAFPDDLHRGNAVVSAGLALLYGLSGGFLVMLGLQLAGDSFFGQWAAAVQLSAGAWIFLLAFFITGAMTSIVMARRSGGSK